MSSSKGWIEKRSSGIFLHLSSLPSPFGIGDLGPWAYRFADFLIRSGQSYWQMLPVNPIDPAYGNSPYSSVSGFAGNTLFISPELLREDGFLSKSDLESGDYFPARFCDYERVIAYKERLFSLAFDRFRTGRTEVEGFEAFCAENAHWLDDFSLFIQIKKRFKHRPWNYWPEEFRTRKTEALDLVRKECRDEIGKEKFLQYQFFKQWKKLRQYCHSLRIELIGDIPIYVSHDSADVWSHPENFKLDETGKPLFVAGVPPDYFSRTGQLWGNPVYRWDVIKKKGFRWWIERIAHQLELFDVLRIDHFRGLVGYWEIPAGEETAVNGHWEKGPADDLFNVLLNRFPELRIIAEDLGFITQDVKECLQRFGFPGMRILLFAFGGENSMHPYLPHMYEKNCVVYVGTHDNNTVRGWFEHEASEDEKRRLFRYLGREVSVSEIHWELVRLAMMSVAGLSIFQMQDLLGLGEEARMNRPSITHGNWGWRLLPEELNTSLGERLGELVDTYGRCPIKG